MPAIVSLGGVRRLFSLLEKAISHKYIRRYKGHDGKYRYVYSESGDRHHAEAKVSATKLAGDDSHYHEGASFSLGKQMGHAVIESNKDGMITFHNDDVDGKGDHGKSQTVSAEQFKKMVTDLHSGDIKRHAEEGLAKRKDIHERAKKAGSEKHIDRASKEVNRWEQLHKEHLPQPKKEVKPEKAPQPEKAKQPPAKNADVAKSPGNKKTLSLLVKRSLNESEKREEIMMNKRRETNPPSPKKDYSGYFGTDDEVRERKAKIANDPHGYQYHLMARGIDINSDFYNKNGAIAASLWDRYGLVLAPTKGQVDLDRKVLFKLDEELEQLNAVFDVRSAVAQHGITLSIDPNVKSKLGGVLHGKYTPSKLGLTIVNPSNDAFGLTFAHELIHALDHHAGYDETYLSNVNPEIKGFFDKNKHQELESSPKEFKEYQNKYHERFARLFQEFSGFAYENGSGVKGKTGFWGEDFHQQNAETVAKLAKKVGIKVRPAFVKYVKDKAL